MRYECSLRNEFQRERNAIDLRAGLPWLVELLRWEAKLAPVDREPDRVDLRAAEAWLSAVEASGEVPDAKMLETLADAAWLERLADRERRLVKRYNRKDGKNGSAWHPVALIVAGACQEAEGRRVKLHHRSVVVTIIHRALARLGYGEVPKATIGKYLGRRYAEFGRAEAPSAATRG